MGPGCGTTNVDAQSNAIKAATVSVAPNPFSESITVTLNDVVPANNYEFRLYNTIGAEVLQTTISSPVTILATNFLSPGFYFYKIISNKTTIETGKLIAR